MQTVYCWEVDKKGILLDHPNTTDFSDFCQKKLPQESHFWYASFNYMVTTWRCPKVHWKSTVTSQDHDLKSGQESRTWNHDGNGAYIMQISCLACSSTLSIMSLMPGAFHWPAQRVLHSQLWEPHCFTPQDWRSEGATSQQQTQQNTSPHCRCYTFTFWIHKINYAKNGSPTSI
jgi:hypothetical protein